MMEPRQAITSLRETTKPKPLNRSNWTSDVKKYRMNSYQKNLAAQEAQRYREEVARVTILALTEIYANKAVNQRSGLSSTAVAEKYTNQLPPRIQTP
jgi:hypothetical protein